MQLYAMILQTCTARKILWIENGIFDSMVIRDYIMGGVGCQVAALKNFSLGYASEPPERASQKPSRGTDTKKEDGSGKKAAAKPRPVFSKT